MGIGEHYNYTECKYCGQTIMEGQIHTCRKMLLAEIADCHATMLRQGQKIVRLEKALQQIAHWYDEGERYFCDTTVTGFALETLEANNELCR